MASPLRRRSRCGHEGGPRTTRRAIALRAQRSNGSTVASAHPSGTRMDRPEPLAAGHETIKGLPRPAAPGHARRTRSTSGRLLEQADSIPSSCNRCSARRRGVNVLTPAPLGRPLAARHPAVTLIGRPIIGRSSGGGPATSPTRPRSAVATPRTARHRIRRPRRCDNSPGSGQPRSPTRPRLSSLGRWGRSGRRPRQQFPGSGAAVVRSGGRPAV
jgi:hypothetical protein